MEFLIAEKIWFSTISFKMLNVGTSEEINLPPAAAFILQVLLQNQGRVVERNRFIDIAWKEYGFELSGNTLNQYISLLRKNFRRLGLEDDAITTLSRVGFCFADHLEVKKPESLSNKKNTRPYKTIAFVILSILVITEILFITNTTHSFSNYNLVRLGSVDGCDIYSTRNLTDTYGKTARELAATLSRKNLVCEKNAVFLFDADGSLIFQRDGRAFLGRCDVSPVTGKFAGCQEILVYETR